MLKITLFFTVILITFSQSILNAQRPSASDNALVSKINQLELEMGYLKQGSFNTTPFLLKYGASETFEVAFKSNNFYQWDESKNELGLYGIQFKNKMYHKDDISFGLSIFNEFVSKSRKINFQFGAMFTHMFDSNELDFSSFYAMNHDDSNIFSYAIVYTKLIDENFSAFIEFYGDNNIGSNYFYQFGIMVPYIETLTFDAAISFPNIGKSSIIQIGLTYAIVPSKN